MIYDPGLFYAIAKEVADGYAEEYLVSFASGGLTVMFSTPAIEDAIAKAKTQQKELGNTSVIAAEFMVCVDQRSYTFSDRCDGVMDVNGVLVEVSVRKIKDGAHRVLFSRVDALQLNTVIVERLKLLENSVASLKAAG